MKEQRDVFLLNKHKEREKQIREIYDNSEIMDFKPDLTMEQAHYSGTQMHLDTMKSLHEIILTYASGVPSKAHFNADRTMERLYSYII
jgi:hypothetical protein